MTQAFSIHPTHFQVSEIDKRRRMNDQNKAILGKILKPIETKYKQQKKNDVLHQSISQNP